MRTGRTLGALGTSEPLRALGALGRGARRPFVADGAFVTRGAGHALGAFIAHRALVAGRADGAGGPLVAGDALIAHGAFIARLAIEVGHRDGSVAVGFAVEFTDIEQIVLGIEVDALEDARAAGGKVCDGTVGPAA